MQLLAILATAVVAFTPASKWTVASHPTGCSLSRTFVHEGSDADLVLTLDASGAGKIDVALDPSNAQILSGEGQMSLLPDGPILKSEYFGGGSFSVAKRLSFVMRLDVNQMASLAMDAARLANSIQIDAMKRNTLLQTGPMSSALTTLNGCRALLIKSWGLEPSNVLPPPELKRAWFHSDVQFGTAGRALISSEAFAILTINADGKPVGCRMIVVSHDHGFDRAACNALIANASFPISTASTAQRSSIVKLAAP